jgi:saccharopine dehydrogenase-like NADP-dependent oxidoreductase
MGKVIKSFVVLGGCGAIGRVVVRDLFESHPHNRVLIADSNERGIQAVVSQFHSRRVTGQPVDCSQIGELTALLRGHSVVINCTNHRLNLHVMSAALAARIHYLDLGGLFYWTRRQHKLDRVFRENGLTAILGMGCAPGITNVMAGQAIELMDRVVSVRIRVGSRDFSSQEKGFCFPYSAQTIMEELTLPPWIWIGGKFRQTRPCTGWEQVRFGRPLGTLWTVRTRHSEVATLPLTFRKKGLRFCDFKVSFGRQFVQEVLRRTRSGWTVRQFSELPAPRHQPNDYEITRVVATGHKHGESKHVEMTLECHSRAKPEWEASAGDLDTACPASVVAQMVATGSIGTRGVLAPETVVPVPLFVQELQQRGLTWVVGYEDSLRQRRTWDESGKAGT